MAHKTAVLQAATTISKTTQTLMGDIIDCDFYDFITLHLAYTTGDETGVWVIPWMLRTLTTQISQDQGWTAAAGTKTATVSKYALTTAVPHHITFDVRGIKYIKFTQGGSHNDGTPTGTLAASYTLK